MTKKIRLIILLVCVICFLIGATILVPYAMGYRFDFENMKVTKTGGIYIRTFPQADQMIVDSKITKKPDLFLHTVFVQSLIPGPHTVLVKKDKYYDYTKTVPVLEKEVTKLENVLLFKKIIQFEVITDLSQSPFAKQEKFIIKNSNLYYSDSEENSGLTATQKITPLLKKIIAFAQQGNNITWLNADGLMYKSDITNLLVAPIKLTLTPIKIIKAGTYKILINDKNIFVNSNGVLLMLNAKTNILDIFYSPIINAVISPDGKNIVYYDENNIYLSPITNLENKKTTLYKSSSTVTNCLWLNNDYIIFTESLSGQDEKIVISEIDYRGNINTVTLPQTGIKNPQIFFDRQEGKLYLQNDNTLLLSEKITQ